MAYSNAVFFLDYEGGSDAVRTSLTSVSVANNGAGLVRCTKAAHGLVTGAVGTASLNYAGAWKVTVIDANTFDLIGSTYSTATALTFVPFGGASKADAWKTFSSGATAARIAPGDTIRVMASPDETLLGNAAWTQYSTTVTLASAVTANITTCDSAWSASANVTASLTSACKEGSNGVALAIAGAFTTGLIGYFATGTLDLSGYQQVSFWIKNSAAVAASTLSLRLCSDAAGVTTVHTITVPALPHTTSIWAAITVDLGANMNSAIASVALYADLDPGAVTISLDNILACKAAASATSLTLNSLIGKARNTGWSAATAYALGDLRIPTAPNRNGYCYKATVAGTSGASEPAWPLGALGVTTIADGGVTWRCEDIEEPWAPLRSINGTTLKIDGPAASTPVVGRGYNGSTETVATYKREAIKTAMVSGTSGAVHGVNDSGTAGAVLTFSGGWNRTDMTTQTGQTWFDAQNGSGSVLYGNGNSYLDVRGFGTVRGYNGVGDFGAPSTISNVQAVGMTQAGWFCNGYPTVVTGRGLITAYSAIGFNFIHSSAMNLARFRADSCDDSGFSSTSSYFDALTLLEGTIQNNALAAFSHSSRAPMVARNVKFGNNGSVIQSASYYVNLQLFNCLAPEATLVVWGAPAGPWDQTIYSTRHNQTADQHLITFNGGTIISATDQRHTASGISWKFRPANSVLRGSDNPLRLSVAKIACSASVALSVTIWTRRSTTNITGTLVLAGGQIGGVPSDVRVTCAPAIDSWVQSSPLTFTPTEAGVVEITFECYDGVGSSANFWVDDLAVS